MLIFKNLIPTNGYIVEFIFKKSPRKPLQILIKYKISWLPKSLLKKLRIMKLLFWVLIPMLRASLLQLILVLHLQRKELKWHLPINHMCGFNLAAQKRTQHQQHNKKSLDLLVNYLSSKQHFWLASQRLFLLN